METGWQSEIVTLPDTGANASEAYGRRTAARTAGVTLMMNGWMDLIDEAL